MEEEEIKKLFELENRWSEYIQKLSVRFSELCKTSISVDDIFNALYLLLADEYEIESPLYLTDMDIPLGILFNKLIDFDFSILLFPIETEKNVLPENLVIQYKVKVKANGLIWIIHRYDKDPFPSAPHAHNIENNIKLDLSNGKCYRVKKHIYTLSERELITIRDKASKVYKGDLPELNYLRS